MTERNAMGNPGTARVNQPTGHEREVAEAAAEHRERPFGTDIGDADADEHSDEDDDDGTPGPPT